MCLEYSTVKYDKMHNAIDYYPYVILEGVDYKIKFYYKYFVLLIINSDQISILLT